MKGWFSTCIVLVCYFPPTRNWKLINWEPFTLDSKTFKALRGDDSRKVCKDHANYVTCFVSSGTVKGEFESLWHSEIPRRL